MDRLEKALEKARGLRRAIQTVPESPPVAEAEIIQNEEPVVVPPAEPADTDAAPKAASRQSKQVAIAQEYLDGNRIVARQSRSLNADLFRILRTKVLQVMAKTGLRTIAITSPNYGDGKTTIAVNLALSLALDVKQTVLLVDLDLRNPDVHKYMGINPTVGLSDYILHDQPVFECMVKPAFDRVVVLPISQTMDNSSEMLGTPKMAQLAHELKTRYKDRLVIYDMPPLLAQDDAIAFLPHVDGVLLVIRDGVTHVNDLRHCMNALADSNLIGTILNNCAEHTANQK